MSVVPMRAGETSSGTARVMSASPPQRNRPWIAVGIIMVAALSCSVAAFAVMERAQAGARAAELERASGVFARVIAEEQAWLQSLGTMLAGDARIRSTLSIAEIDEKTIADILQDLLTVPKVSVLAALDDRGRVRGAAGADSLRRTDLGGTALLRSVLGTQSTGRDIWTLGDRVVDVVSVPVPVGLGAQAYLLVGRDLDAETLDSVIGSSDVVAAVVVGGNAATHSARAKDHLPRLAAAAASGSSASRSVRVDVLSSGSTPVQLVWMATGAGEAALVRAVPWLPLFVGFIASGLLLVTRRKESR